MQFSIFVDDIVETMFKQEPSGGQFSTGELSDRGTAILAEELKSFRTAVANNNYYVCVIGWVIFDCFISYNCVFPIELCVTKGNYCMMRLMCIPSGQGSTIGRQLQHSRQRHVPL